MNVQPPHDTNHHMLFVKWSLSNNDLTQITVEKVRSWWEMDICFPVQVIRNGKANNMPALVNGLQNSFITPES
jgi:hypothetical protein